MPRPTIFSAEEIRLRRSLRFKRWYRRNQDAQQSKAKKFHHDNPQLSRARCKSWRSRNPRRIQFLRTRWRRENPETYRASRRNSARRRSPIRRIGARLRCRIKNALKDSGVRKSPHTTELIGCTIPELRRHLEKQFVDGMAWWNYGLFGWHIEHIKPLVHFDLTDPAQQRACFHHTNLRPLWAEDNIAKSLTERRKPNHQQPIPQT